MRFCSSRISSGGVSFCTVETRDRSKREMCTMKYLGVEMIGAS
jgi:hypothetical protein